MKTATDLPFLLPEGTAAVFVPPVIDAPRQGIVASIDEVEDSTYLVHFDSVSDRTTASMLVGCHILVQLSAEQRQVLAQDPQSWAGWEVIDAQWGYLGEVHSITENPGQTLLQVSRRADGAPDKAGAGEGSESAAGAVDAASVQEVSAKGKAGSNLLLIPLVDEFIANVDIEARIIETSIPAGLLSL